MAYRIQHRHPDGTDIQLVTNQAFQQLGGLFFGSGCLARGFQMPIQLFNRHLALAHLRDNMGIFVFHIHKQRGLGHQIALFGTL